MKHNCDDHQDAALLPAVCDHHTAHKPPAVCLRPPHRAAQDPRCLRPPYRAAQDPRCLRPPHRAAQDPRNRAHRLCDSRRDRSIEARRSPVQVRLTKHSHNVYNNEQSHLQNGTRRNYKCQKN
ncbi:hypothetical protein FI667_g9594, partial [Globisporangium splendens]